METTSIHRSELRALRGPFHPVDDHVPAEISCLGRRELLGNRLLGYFCSVSCPADLAVEGVGAVEALLENRLAVIGGFQSPGEKQCLAVLLRRHHPVVICPGRAVETIKRLPPDWRSPLAEGRLLILSSLEPKVARVTSDIAQLRNHLVAALADELLVSHASPGGKTEQLCRDAITWGKPLFTLDSVENAGLIALGAHRIKPESAVEQAALIRLSR